MTTTYAMPLELDLGPVELTVGDLDRSLEYYTSSIGLQVLEQGSGSAQLGVAGRPLAVLQEIPGAAPAPSSSAGLSHFAPRVPSRADLARFARHCIDQGLDTDLRAHGNAESAYVIDADGHTVEVTWHRPPCSGIWSTANQPSSPIPWNWRTCGPNLARTSHSRGCPPTPR